MTACDAGRGQITHRDSSQTDDTGRTQVPVTEVSSLCAASIDWSTGDSSLLPPYYLEGDTVNLTLRCTGNVEAHRVRFVPLEIPNDSLWSDIDNQLTLVSDASSGGRYDIMFSVQISEDTDFPETIETSFWIGDNPDITGAIPPEPLEYTEEWGLPVFHVESDGSIGNSYEPTIIIFDGVRYEAEIQKRGAVSIYYPKNSYGLRFANEEIDLEDYGIEQRRDHLVLISPFDDNSYIRQRLIYELWYEMSAYWQVPRLTPRTFFAVVYLDGEYFGLYTASDRIDNEFVMNMGLNEDGNLYKAVNHDANFYLTTSGGAAKTTLAAGYEKKEGEPESGEGAFDDLIELVSMTGSSSPHDFNLVADEWIQTDEFMDWYWLIQISSAYDSAGKNSYLYNDPTDDQPFRFAPWDFNYAWGQDWRTLRIDTDNDNDLTDTNAIFAHFLWGNSEALISRYQQMRTDGPLAENWLIDKTNEYVHLLGPAIDRDWERWADSHQNYGGWEASRNSSGDWTTPEEEILYLQEWLIQRGQFLDSWTGDF